MAQQTAVEWLIEKILYKSEEYINDDGDYVQIPKTVFYNAFKDYVDLSDYVNEAKQMEKEQIITAASIGILWGEDEEQLQSSVKFGEEYYDRTFTSTPQGENPSATRNEQS